MGHGRWRGVLRLLGCLLYSPLGLHISKSVLTTREGAVTVGFTALGA